MMDPVRFGFGTRVSVSNCSRVDNSTRVAQKISSHAEISYYEFYNGPDTFCFLGPMSIKIRFAVSIIAPVPLEFVVVVPFIRPI